jgi:hypothetical protein
VVTKWRPAASDAIIQEFSPPSKHPTSPYQDSLLNRKGGEPVWQAGGTYPLEGGYFYLNPANSPTYVYSLGFTGGLPIFTLAAKTAEYAPANAGVGPPVITSYQGQPGTAIVWVCDPNNRLRAYYAVPKMAHWSALLCLQAPAINKFQRPVFGNGRYYIASNNGAVYVCLTPRRKQPTDSNIGLWVSFCYAISMQLTQLRLCSDWQLLRI